MPSNIELKLKTSYCRTIFKLIESKIIAPGESDINELNEIKNVFSKAIANSEIEDRITSKVINTIGDFSGYSSDTISLDTTLSDLDITTDSNKKQLVDELNKILVDENPASHKILYSEINDLKIVSDYRDKVLKKFNS